MVRISARTTCALLLILHLFGNGIGAERPATTVPAPRDVLGFEPGDDYQLADFRQLRDYFQKLAAASPRVRLDVAGRSTEGNEMLVAAISSEANLERLERYRTIARRLALVEGVSPAEARALAREGRAIVWIDSGLHASEVSTAQHAIALAYRVATEESEEMREVRDKVILVLAPCINPDGMNMVVDWYRRTLRTPYQDSPMPWLYQKYVGHDNNRDSYMVTQKETEVVNRLLYDEWLPQIMYNQHQGTWPPRIFVPPFPDPFNPNIDPEVMRGVDLVGGAMQQRFEREGKDGVISRYLFSIWYNGSVRTASYFHNMIGILTETGHATATPYTYDPADFPATLSNGVSTLTPSVTYPHPWPGGTLHLRDAVNYMLTGSLGVLEVAAKYREQLLYGIYRIGARQIEKGRTEPPIAYLIPPDQHDRPAAALFAATLMKSAVQVHRARRSFQADGNTYPEGTLVVRLAQPFRPFAKDLLEPQRYPDLRSYPGGPPQAPYDTAGWTLSFQMGVRTVPVRVALDESALVRLEAPPVAAGGLDRLPGGDAWGVVVEGAANESFALVNQLLADGVAVQRIAEPLRVRPGITLDAGAWIVRTADGTTTVRRGGASAPPNSAAPPDSARGTDGCGTGRCADPDDVAALLNRHGLRAWTLAAPPDVRTTEVHPRRIGIYKSWVANSDEGWTRWLLEEYGFRYVSLSNADIRGADLRNRVDVIVLPDQSPRAILQGHQPSRRPSTPGPWNPPPPEYQGGIGAEGVGALKAFVRAGGTLVALDEASDIVLDRFGGIFDDISDRTRDLPRTTFYCPGSVLRITVDASRPLAWGMERQAAAYFESSRAFESQAPGVVHLARYAAADRLLMSGWLLGAGELAGRDAALEVPYGGGRVVLFGFRPQFRAQPHGTFKLLFNALY